MSNNNQQWRGKSRGGAFGYNFFIWLIKSFGISVAYAFLCLVVLYFIPFSPKSTRSIWYYSRNILFYGPISSALFLVRSYYRFGQVLIDKTAISIGLKERYNFRFDNYEEFLNILNSGDGVVIMSAHIGNWESGAPFFDDYGKKINIVLYDAEYEKIKEVIERNRESIDYKIIAINREDISHIFKIREALAAGEYLCFQGDRVVVDEGKSGSGKSITAEKVFIRNFMGREALFPSGPFLLASRLKVPVVFYFAMRERNKSYRFYFYSVDTTTPKSEEELLDAYLEKLTEIVRRYPEQWFNYYKFWR